MADYKSGFVNKVNVNNTDVPISYVETEYKDTTNNLQQYKGDFSKRKVYTDVLGLANTTAKANTWANRTVYYITVIAYNNLNVQKLVEFGKGTAQMSLCQDKLDKIAGIFDSVKKLKAYYNI